MNFIEHNSQLSFFGSSTGGGFGKQISFMLGLCCTGFAICDVGRKLFTVVKLEGRFSMMLGFSSLFKGVSFAATS
jgi:hypothetical protein